VSPDAPLGHHHASTAAQVGSSGYFDHFVGADFLEQRFNAHRFMGSDDQV
jgi:hypothetical protein